MRKRDEQGNEIKHDKQRQVSIAMESHDGEHLQSVAKFEVASVPGAILSAGKLIRKGYRAALDQNGIP